LYLDARQLEPVGKSINDAGKVAAGTREPNVAHDRNGFRSIIALPAKRVSKTAYGVF
jgi:hypothetical protein